MEVKEIIEVWKRHGVEVLPHFTEIQVCQEIAEIIFKRGMEYCREQDPEKWDNLEAMLEAKKQEGMKKVVEWIERNKKIKLPKYQLKEWGIEE